MGYALKRLINDISPLYNIQELPTLDSAVGVYDFYVVGVSEFIRNLQYFLPRRHSIVLIDTEPIKSNDCAEELPILSAQTSTEETYRILNEMLPNVHKETSFNIELTPREKEVLCLLASGKTIKEIANELFISVNTTLTHRKNISTKLGIRSVSGLSLYAIMNGYI